MSAILPTHECFDDAAMFLIDPPPGVDRHQAIVVHGIIRTPLGVRYAHAWVEFDGEVYQAGIFPGAGRQVYAIPLADFVRLYNVRYAVRYTLEEYLSTADRLGDDSPPWDPYVRALTSRSSGEWLEEVGQVGVVIPSRRRHRTDNELFANLAQIATETMLPADSAPADPVTTWARTVDAALAYAAVCDEWRAEGLWPLG